MEKKYFEWFLGTAGNMDDGETMDYLNGRIRRIQIAVCGHRVAQKVIADGYPGPDSLSVHWMA